MILTSKRRALSKGATNIYFSLLELNVQVRFLRSSVCPYIFFFTFSTFSLELLHGLILTRLLGTNYAEEEEIQKRASFTKGR
jgi:hypothetical protein